MSVEQKIRKLLNMSKPEPPANCYECPNRFGQCAEYTKLNPGSVASTGKPYNRKYCHWGAESIRKEKEEHREDRGIDLHFEREI